MFRKRFSFTCLIIFFISIISSNIILTSAQGGWNLDTLVSYAGGPPVIDGIADDTWSNANSSTTSIENKNFELFVQHYGDNLYFLIQTDFASPSTINKETFSIYLSNSDSEEDIFDKKQITLLNTSSPGYEYSQSFDFYKEEDSDEYVLDSNTEGFQGIALYSQNMDENVRNYEFQIAFEPTNSSSIEDVSLALYETIMIKVGYNNTLSPIEVLSESLLVQLGPDTENTETEIGEYNFNTDLYILIVLITISVIFGVYGVVLVNSKNKVGDIELLEEED